MAVSATTDLLLSYETKRNGKQITQLDLQKFLYLIEGFHLAIVHEPLFDEEFEAWVNGPVLPSVYSRFKFYKGSPIGPDAMVTKPHQILSNGVTKLAGQVWDNFSHLNPGQLVGITHLNDGPWKKTRDNAGVSKKENSDAIIPKEMILEYFSGQYGNALTPRKSVIGLEAQQAWEKLAV